METPEIDVSKPAVYCRKEGKQVPIWYCTGSFYQGRKRCPHMVKVTVRIAQNQAEVQCEWKP